MTLQIVLRRYVPNTQGIKLTGVCVNGCKVKQEELNPRAKQGKWVALIFGKPAAALCDVCAEEWITTWQECGGEAEMTMRKPWK